MRFQFHLIDRELLANPRRYLFQVSVATLALFVVLWMEFTLARAVIVAAIASTAFILFITPATDTSTPRHVIGGHFIALVVGCTASLLDIPGPDAQFMFALRTALSVGVAMFLMAATNTEHAPAAGTTLGVAIIGYSLSLIAFFCFSILTLVLIKALLRPWLHNLY